MIYYSNAAQVMREARARNAANGSNISISDVARKGDAWINSALQSVKQAALNNQSEMRARILSRVEGLSNPYDAQGMQEILGQVVGKQDLFDPSGASSTYSPSYPMRNSARTVDYWNADIAKHYKMDARAAYSEALQNTAYQRAVADLKAAGLNPVLAAGSVSPAGSFAAGDTLSYGAGSGSSGVRSGGKSGKYAFTENQYNMLGVVGSVVGGVLGYKYSPAPWKLMGASTGAALGKNLLQSGAQGVSSLLGMFGD